MDKLIEHILSFFRLHKNARKTENDLLNADWDTLVARLELITLESACMTHAYYNQKNDFIFTIGFLIEDVPDSWYYLGEV